MPLGGIEPSFLVPKTSALSVELQRRICCKIIPQMSDIREQIEAIEKEIRETPYHKGTEHHIGRLRARIAKLKDKEFGLEAKKSAGGGGGYALKKQGDATVVLLGPPSVGKSTLINKLTNAESKVAGYAFTTVSVIPGMLRYRDAYIQILDLPGLLEGASQGKGRGKEVLSVARAADLLLVMTDVKKINSLDKVREELHKSGIRLNTLPPKINIAKKNSGGINIVTNVQQPLAKKTIVEMAQELGIKNADIALKEPLEVDSIIDAFLGNRVYIPSIFVVNKVDLSGLRGNLSYIYISAQNETGLEELREKIWERLGLIRLYLVGPDEKLTLENPIIAKQGDNLRVVAEKLASDLTERKKIAKIWRAGAKFPGQEVSLTTLAQEGMQVRFV